MKTLSKFLGLLVLTISLFATSCNPESIDTNKDNVEANTGGGPITEPQIPEPEPVDD